MSAKTSKYEISMTEQANAQWAFESWLKKHAGEEAAKALSTITAALSVARSYRDGLGDWPESAAEKDFAERVKADLHKTIAWLKAEGENITDD